MQPGNSFFIIIGLALLGGLFVMLSILMGGGNEIAAFYQYLLIVLCVVGVVAPRGAFTFWLMLCGYTDLFKRFMIFTGRVSFTDLYAVLGIPPLMLSAITVSVVIGAFSGRFQLRKIHWMMLAFSCLTILAVAGFAAHDSGFVIKAVLPAVANNGLYFLLFFLVPALYQTTDEIVKMMRWLLWAYLPVALYGIFQQIYGYREFEIAYLKSGLSIEIKQLLANEVRAFSTLNSTTALATVSGVLITVSVILLFLPQSGTQRRALGWLPGVLFATAYVGGMVASTGRAAVTVIAFGLCGWLCFRSKKLIIAAYLCSIAGFVILVFSAESLLANMNFFQDEVAAATGGDHTFMQQMTRVGTYSDRLQGFANLVRNPDVWTLFGHRFVADDDRTLASHDILTNTLVHYGAVPVAFALLMLMIALIRAHRGVLGIQDPTRKNLSAGLLALALSFIVLSLLAGNVLVIFPINVFVCFFCGALLVIFQHEETVRTEEMELIPATEPQPQKASTPVRVIHRFTRSGKLPA
jgi:hypothetical protein